MADNIDVHFEPPTGRLFLSCGDEAFARIRDAVCAEAAVGRIVAESSVPVRYIEIEAVPPDGERIGPVRSALFLLGCALVVCAMLFVFITGLSAIVSWFR
jgi:hypothetical protein